MIIRCERCSTLYELDESLLSPEGSPVQCTRCQAVFTARPPLGQGRTLVGVPAATEAAQATTSPPTSTATSAPTSTATSTATAPPPAAPASTPTATGGPAPQPPPRPKAARPSPAVYRPPAPSSPSPAAVRGPAVRRDTVGAFEARLKASLTLRKLALPLAALVVAAGLVGGWAVWRRRPDPEAGRLRAEAAARLAQDDTASLARAVELADAALAREPGQVGALADRALARVLSSAARVEELEPATERVESVRREQERLQREQQPGWEEAEKAAGEEVARLEADLAPRRKEAEALAAQGLADLEALARAPAGEAAAARGLAVAFALAGDGGQVARYAGLARAAGPDPWADLAEAWLDLRQNPAARDQAVQRLQQLITAHPELIRARYLLARAQAAAGRREEAEATLAGLLAANPRHERAQRLKGTLSVPAGALPAAPPPVAAAPATAPAPPPARPAEVRRPAPAPPAPIATPAVEVPAATPPAPEPEPTPAAAPMPEPVKPAPPPPPPRKEFDPTPLDPMQYGGG